MHYCVYEMCICHIPTIICGILFLLYTIWCFVVTQCNICYNQNKEIKNNNKEMQALQASKNFIQKICTANNAFLELTCKAVKKSKNIIL